MALGGRVPMTALACQDATDHSVEDVPVRAYAGNRARFVLANLLQSRQVTRVIYDHPGTARAHFDLPGLRRPYAVWAYGWELWNEPRADYVRALRRAALVLAISDYAVQRAGRTLDGMTVRVCPLGTFEDTAPPAPDSEGPPTLLLVGRADDLFAKGHDLLIEVWPDVLEAVPAARLVLVGGGPALGRVQELASASPARLAIEVAGFVPDDRLDQFWNRATAFAMPGFAEGFGLVYAEAMRRSIPVIASTDDAAKEVNVHGVTGYNVPRSDRAGLIEAIVRLLRDPSHAARVGQAGHARWRERYTFSMFQRRLLEITADFVSPC